MQPIPPKKPRPPRSPDTFTGEWLILCGEVSRTREPIVLHCASPEEARSILAKFNSYKSSLSRSGDPNIKLLRQVSARIEDANITFSSREESVEARLIREALAARGKSGSNSRGEEDLPEISLHDLLGRVNQKKEEQQR